MILFNDRWLSTHDELASGSLDRVVRTPYSRPLSTTVTEPLRPLLTWSPCDPSRRWLSTPDELASGSLDRVVHTPYSRPFRTRYR
jgi:hypothetical protein